MTSSNLSVPDEERTDEDAAVDEEQQQGEDQSSEPEPLPLDVVFEILKNKRRRLVLRFVKEQDDESVDLGELAEHVAALENDKSVSGLTSGERKRVYVGLYQCHLPKMDDADIVEFDRNRGTIELGECADQLEEYLDNQSSDETVWPRYYLSITLIGAGLFLIGQAGLFPADWIQSVIVLAMMAALAGCAVLHSRST
jgi:hypothetical protein